MESKVQQAAIVEATAWRVVTLLQFKMDRMRSLILRRLRLQDGVQRLAKRKLMRAGRLIIGNPGVKRAFITSASRLGLASRLSRLYWSMQSTANGFQHGWPDSPQTTEQLTPHARQVFADLRNAIQQQAKEQG